MSVEFKTVYVKIISLGEFTVKMKRVNAPRTIDSMWQILPISGRAIKQGPRLIMPTDIKSSKEKSRVEFVKGDISFDPSSSNLSIHLASNTLTTPENFLGHIEEDFSVDHLPVTSTILIKPAV